MDQTGHFPTTQIYVASTWRNTLQPKVVQALTDAGYGVYDFRKPGNGIGFGYDSLVDNHEDLEPSEFV